MDITELETYKLIRQSAKICRHCKYFRKPECSKAPDFGSYEFKNFNWSSLSTCDKWTPNKRTEQALQVLTWRKLQGNDITDFLYDIPEPEDEL